MQKMFCLNKQMGWFSFQVCGFMLLVVWGWCGNCYRGKRATLVLDFGTGVFKTNFCIVELDWRRLQTRIYFRRKVSVDWNSEHIAVWLGKEQEAPFGCCHFYRGWLGNHNSV